MVTSSTYIQDVLNCRLELEKRFGILVRGSAYDDRGITSLHPDVTYDTIEKILKNLGVVYSRTLGGDNSRFNLPSDWYAWMPTAAKNFARHLATKNYRIIIKAGKLPAFNFIYGAGDRS